MTTISLDPNIIRFTHSKIRKQFSGCGKLLSQTLDELKNKIITSNDIPKITVMFDGSNYYSLNNRRLWIFKQCKQLNILNEIVVYIKYIKPDKRYTPERCVLEAKIKFT